MRKSTKRGGMKHPGCCSADTPFFFPKDEGPHSDACGSGAGIVGAQRESQTYSDVTILGFKKKKTKKNFSSIIASDNIKIKAKSNK